MLNYLAVFVGGGLGSLCRYTLGQYLPSASFPWATLAANIAACFILGYLTGYLLKNHLDEHFKVLIGAGFCGGFSTFSSFSSELLKLNQNGLVWTALGYMVVSMVLGLVAVGLGVFLASSKL